MRRLRAVAAAVAILTALIDLFLSRDPDIHAGAVVSAAFAAACLAAFTPFNVLNPRGRKLVTLACAMFLVAVSGALMMAIGSGSEPAPTASLAFLSATGVVLTGWAFTIRNRRRRPGWGSYYDN